MGSLLNSVLELRELSYHYIQTYAEIFLISLGRRPEAKKKMLFQFIYIKFNYRQMTYGY
jgi:hypothetical protein